MRRAPSTLLRATKAATAPRFVTAKKAAAAPRLLRALKGAAVVASGLLSAGGCSIFTTIGDYDAQHAGPDTACCAPEQTYYACDVILQGTGVDSTPYPVGLCASDIDTARQDAVSDAQAQYPGLTATTENCEIPGCPVDGGAS